MKHFYRILAIFITLVIIAATIAGIFYGALLRTEISSEVERYGLAGVFAIAFATDFIPQYISPHFLLTGISVPGISRIWLLIVIIAGSTVGSILGFRLGHKIREHVIEDIFGKRKYEKVRKGMNKHGRWYVALAAVSPLPYIPMIIGSLNMSCKNFFIFGVIPRIAGIVVLALFLNGIF